MVKALVFFDLDKTLLDDKKQVPEGNLKALKKLQANDCLPVICTGRNLWELKDLMAQTGITTAIAGNGADMLLRGEHLYQSPIGKPQLSRLLKAAKKANLPVAMYNDQTVALTAADENTKANYQLVVQPDPQIEPDFGRQHTVAMLLLFTPWTEAGEKVGDQFRANFPELTFYRNGPYALDVVNTGITKGHGIDLLLQRPEFSKVPTYAFGDGNNDIAMLQRVDTGVAMGNALPQVAAIADYQTAGYLDNGIPKALKHFGLIEG